MTHPAISGALLLLHGVTPEEWAETCRTHRKNIDYINRLARELRDEKERKENEQ